MSKKIVIVSTIQPSTHYTRFLKNGYNKTKNTIELWVDKSDENLKLSREEPNLNIKLVWDKNLFLPWQIFLMVIKEQISIVHLQHEFNMYGKLNGILVFPVLLLLLRMRGAKVIVTVHAIPAIDEIDKEFIEMMGINKVCSNTTMAKLVFLFIYKSISLLANVVIVHSAYTKNVFIKDYGARIPVKVIPIGIAPAYNEFEDGKNFKNPFALKNKSFLLFFGYIMPRKGLEELVEAFFEVSKKKKNLYLVLAGGILSGNQGYYASLVERCKRYHLEERVIFTNFVEPGVIDWLYKHCEMVVLPYLRSISSSLPLAFALGYGKIVLASNIGTLRDEIVDGKTGFYCKPGEVSDLVEKILKLYKNTTKHKLMDGYIKQEQKRRSWSNVARVTSLLYR